jgi:tryptophanyl-tRNA synthetase
VAYANYVDEKYLLGKLDREVAELEHYARENSKDIIATGLNPERTFIFSDYTYSTWVEISTEMLRESPRFAIFDTCKTMLLINPRE